MGLGTATEGEGDGAEPGLFPAQLSGEICRQVSSESDCVTTTQVQFNDTQNNTSCPGWDSNPRHSPKHTHTLQVQGVAGGKGGEEP